MNHFFMEVRGREKIKELQREGLMSQAFYTNKAIGSNILAGFWSGISIILRHVIHNLRIEKRQLVEPHTHT